MRRIDFCLAGLLLMTAAACEPARWPSGDDDGWFRPSRTTASSGGYDSDRASSPFAGVGLGEACSMQGDCGSGLVCAGTTCQAACRTSADCIAGNTCLSAVCRNVTDIATRTCETDSDCGAASACMGGTCRRQCAGVRDGLAFLVSTQGDLWSFDPSVPGRSAYERIGQLECPAGGSPQTMAVDRQGLARVFFDNGELFEVSTATGQCRATSYEHPDRNDFNELGMAFTADAPGSPAESLITDDRDTGLWRVDPSTYAVRSIASPTGRSGELAGGADGRLFEFSATTAELFELDRGTSERRRIAVLRSLAGIDVMAFAFVRVENTFYVFTAAAGEGTRTATFDLVTGEEAVRDTELPFTVVGAGRSTCPVTMQ